ncbi:MAG TPA: M20/M25/M40 family metallo-hydrolase [Gemmatimonadaceae bacterium]|nr:M20/M25/M40 family metallo-hydrolase [Gemmatimonadaceae bacterium]
MTRAPISRLRSLMFVPRRRTLRAGLAAVALVAVSATAQLSPGEQRMREFIRAHQDDQIAMLQRAVDINSGTMNFAGVRAVGALFASALDSLGFETRWITLPDSVNRAGHLVAVHRGRPGAPRLLLIGHFDTVFEGDGQQFVRDDTVARGAGSSDMKGGDVIIVYALKALRDAGLLDGANITAVFTGDEESPGMPLALSRQALRDAAQRSDVALAFEAGSQTLASVSRRGASSWLLTVEARQSHSAGVFSRGAGYGAIYEAARILDTFRRELAGEPDLTFNPGVILGGAHVAYDTAHLSGTVAGKTNIIAPSAVVPGDLRFISEAQKDSARARMRDIVAQHLPGTSAQITFEDAYPALPMTPGGARLIALYDSASRALGYGPVAAQDPATRGAGDVSFVGPYIPGIDGLGALGRGAHTPREEVDLNSLNMQTARAAVLMARLLENR